MGNLRKIVLLLIIGLLLFSVYSVSSDEPTELPTEENLKPYINNLINSYNELVTFEIRKPDSQLEKDDFALYHELGYYFNVFCVKANISSNLIINIIFEPKSGETLDIAIDFEHQLQDYIPLRINHPGAYVKDYLVEYSDTIINADLIIGVFSEEITNNTLENAMIYAKFLFNAEKEYKERKIELDKINEIWEPLKEEYQELILNNRELWEIEWRIDKEISYNDNYIYESFQQDLQEFNEIIQNIVNPPKPDGLKYSIFFLILCLFFIGFVIIAHDYMKNKWIHASSWIIRGIFLIICAWFIMNAPNGYFVYQFFIPPIALILLLVIMKIKEKKYIKNFRKKYKKRKEMKIRINKLIENIKRNKKPKLTSSEIIYIFDSNNSKWINKIKDIDILKQYIIKNTKKWGKKIQKICDKQKNIIPEHYKDLDKIF